MTWVEVKACRMAYCSSADGFFVVGELGGLSEWLLRWETEVGKWGEWELAAFPFRSWLVPACRDGACPVSRQALSIVETQRAASPGKRCRL